MAKEKWIQDAINPEHKGALHRALHVPEGVKIPQAKIVKAEHSSNEHVAKMARLADTLSRFHR